MRQMISVLALAGDPKARLDGEVVTRLRRIPIVEIRATERDLVATRVRRSRSRAAARHT